MNQDSSNANSKSGVLPIQRSRSATTSSTLYPLHQARVLLRELRPGSTAAPSNLVDAFRLDTLPSNPTITYNYAFSAGSSNRNTYNLVQILDEALSVLQDDSQCSIGLEEPCNCNCNCNPPRNECRSNNNNKNSPRS